MTARRFPTDFVDAQADGTGAPAEAPVEDALEERDGMLIIPGAGGIVVDDELVRSLRDADRK